MALLSLLRFPSASASPPPYSHRRNIATTALLRRRAPLVGALWVLSLGTFTTFACRTGCSLSLPFLRSKGRTLHSTAMASASTTVPSIVVYVTVPNKEAGKKLSESIIKERLAACVNRVPGIESVYWWDGKVQSDAEELLIIKTRESLLNALTEHVKANHEYDLPEVIALPIKGGNEKYLEWIKNSTKDE
ncbi:protein CutA 1, chloroplastic isoform X2 [Dioscorea cayenensis subsp. rotundata]|uniref:Protein CutA 1, chloroplastic isoform X2 n=1 Tax=Dioscorea cayennensis subsp. rotundata TaxID=55577 RepID=A0AB40BK17_DIOCR|nr:protein CutA 1, chloroplastic isoform X2 [Dioscorea cayenensis subsp. rotundata]